MTAETMSTQHPPFSLAEQAFLDAENGEEQNLAGEYLSLCSAVEDQIRSYLRTHPADLPAGCRFVAARTDWNRTAWMQADHDQRIRMIEDQTDILQHIGFCQPRRNPQIQQILGDCGNLIGQLRWIRNVLQFDRGDASVWDRAVSPW